MCKKCLFFMSIALILIMSAGAAWADSVWEGRIADGMDDTEEEVSNGAIDSGSSDLELPNDGGLQYIAMRFSNVSVPSGSAIFNAYLEFQVDEVETDAVANLVIQGELSANAPALTNTAFDISSRPRTEGQVLWSPEHYPTTGETKLTTDISPVIEEIVGQAGWVSGNSLVVIVYDDPDNPSVSHRTVEAYDGDAAGAALLHIEFGPAVKAGNPTPGNGATEVSRDVVLAWKSGVFAGTHNVYLGTDAGTISEVSQGQTETTYDPGRLAFDQTYYWRVDEVNSTPDRTVMTGDLWSFTVEPLAIPVTGVAPTASSIDAAGQEADRTVDGSGLNANDEHSTDLGNMWLSNRDESEGVWIQYDLGKIHKLDQMHVWNHNSQTEAILGYGIKEALIETSTDGETWSELKTVEFAQGTGLGTYTGQAVPLDSVVAQYVRITALSNYSILGLKQFGLSEVRFMAIPVEAREPIPADGATMNSATVDLGWRAGREAASHEVYLGTDPNNLALVGTSNLNSYTASGLDFSTTYSWSVTEVNTAEEVTAYDGPVWSFTTSGFEVVDDFDGYNDDMDGGTTIFQTWQDGFDDKNNGALVSYLTSPFCEQTIVKSGQSMPLSYDNAAGNGTSEVILPLNQDWTVSGIKTLALAFFGKTGNTGTLYVKVNSTKKPYDMAASDIASSGWHAWNIDLTSISGLNSVKSLTIGVDGANAAGLVYIDDIRLYAEAGEVITPVAPATTALIGHWKFDGDVQDASGKGNHGTVGGAPFFVAGKDGQAIDLGGGADYVAIDGVVDDITSTDMTISLWINTTQADEGELVAANDSTSGHPFMLGVSGGNVYVNDGGDTLFPPAINDGEWHHAAYVREGSQGTVSVDGRSVGSYVSGFELDTVTRWSFGQEWDDATASNFYMGRIDEARIYDAPLSPAEVASLAGLTEMMHKPF